MINAIISAITAIILSAVFLTGLYLTMTATAFVSTGNSPYLYYNNRVVNDPGFETTSRLSDGSSGCHDVDRTPEIYRPGKSPESG